MLSRLMIERGARMGIAITKEQAEQFECYHCMLTEANARMNLTRVPDDISEAVDRNYLDCAAMVLPEEVRAAKRIADVGSGAGFPGIPMSILLPDCRFTLMDALDKRVRFLQDVIAELGLHAEAVHIRAELAGKAPEYRECFDVAVARAVAALPLLSEYLLPLVRVGGHMAVMKGPGLEDELTAAGNALSILGGTAERIVRVEIPDRDWDHRVALIRKSAQTPAKYPRKPGMPEKRPL